MRLQELHLLPLLQAVLETASDEMKIPLPPFDMRLFSQRKLGMLAVLFDFPSPESVPLDSRSEDSVVSH